ncbi:hypothetical protein [Cerasicoccus fimbriatus]|uniref:hypothetical protein n=1 Tax=Cerasicoccus fimbriatus TaxID=3014554 RepID=UPI0022B4BA09|nr:hypothetical protein [Cerasicoccus sp. TK19100]
MLTKKRLLSILTIFTCILSTGCKNGEQDLEAALDVADIAAGVSDDDPSGSFSAGMATDDLADMAEEDDDSSDDDATEEKADTSDASQKAHQPTLPPAQMR